MYLEGNIIRIEGSFRNEHGSLFDPATVTFMYKTPSGVTDELEGASVERLRTGRYVALLLVDAPGIWTIQWSCTGTYVGIREKQIRVAPREIT